MNSSIRTFDLRGRAACSGFTLIEAVVALAILALTLTVVYHSFGWALRRSAEQRQRELAWLTAQSLLSRIRIDHSIGTGHHSGRTPAGLSWESKVEPYALPFATQGAIAPVQVTVRVSWGDGHGQQLELHSIELGNVR